MSQSRRFRGPRVAAVALAAGVLVAAPAVAFAQATPTPATSTATPSPGTPEPGTATPGTVTPTPTPATTPSPPATPAPAGTPWPAPTGLSVTYGPDQILNPDNSFIPPDQRVYRTSAMWDVAAGFTGRYEIEFAREYYPGGTALTWVPYGTRPASDAVDGRLSVTEPITFTDFLDARFCFRVRTVVEGVVPPAVETGPWAEACTVFPPTTGPAPTPTIGPGVPPVVPPGPPATGAGRAAPVDAETGWLAAAALALAGAVTAVAATRRARG